MTQLRNSLVTAFVSQLAGEFEYHPFVTPFMNVKKTLEHFLHQYEILALLSIRRPVRVLIADEIGLGKTITAIAVAKYLEKIGEARKILVIVPRILLNQWITELNGMGITTVYDIERYSIDLMKKRDFPAGYYIGSIDLLKREQYIEAVSTVNWDLIIVDEAHKMSIKGSKKTLRYNEIGGKLVGSKPGMHTIFLSATPHKGDPEDYISRLRLLDPMLGSPKELDNRNFYKTTHEVLVFRRTKEDVNDIYEGREVFKPATFFAVALPATEEERAFSEKLLEFMRTKLIEFADRGLLMDTRVIPLLRALLFKRASSSPKAAMLTMYRMFTKRSVEAALNEQLIEEVEGVFEFGYEDYEYEDRKDPDEVVDEFVDAVSDLLSERDKEEVRTLYQMAESIVTKGDTKINALLEILSDLIARGNEKIIVFTEYKDTLNYIKSKILEAHPDWKNKLLSLTSEEAQNRELLKRIRTRFEQDSDCRILLATDVAAEGLNLQVSNLLINYEVPWSIVKLEQRIGRVWRLGQKRDVEIYTLFLGNKSDRDALDILYQKLINLRRAEIPPRPLMGQEVLVYQTSAEEIGKVPMAVAEEGKKFRKVTERTLIDAYVRGGSNELVAIVRSIIAAKQALQNELQSKSVFYSSKRRERIEERLSLLGFKDISELASSFFSMFKAASPFYGYNVIESTDSGLRVQQPTGMPLVISQVNQVMEILKDGPAPPTSAPILVSYSGVEETISIYRVEVYGKGDKLLLREPIGISENGSILRGKKLLEVVSHALANLIGVTDSVAQRPPELDKILIVNAPNSALDSTRRLLNPVEEYLTTITKLGLRNAGGEFVRQRDLEARLQDKLLGVIRFVKKPLVPLEEISQELKEEAERKAIQIVLEVERSEGRLAEEIPLTEQKNKHYDVHSISPQTQEERLIEVKGHMGPEVYGELTDDEAQVAKREGKRYWLYIVYNIADKAKFLRFSDPFNTMNFSVVEKVTKETRYVMWPKVV